MTEPVNTITAAKLALLTGLQETQLAKLAARGFYTKPKSGSYILLETLKGLFRYFREAAAISEKQNESGTAAWCALELSCDRATINRIIRDCGVKPVGKSEGHETYRLSEVRLAHDARKKLTASPLRDQLISEQIRKLRIVNDTKERVVISRTEVAAKLGAFWQRTGDQLTQRLENELPAAMAGLDVPGGRVIAKRMNDTIRADIVRAAKELLPA